MLDSVAADDTEFVTDLVTVAVAWRSMPVLIGSGGAILPTVLDRG